MLEAEQTRGHTCHWPGCSRQVPPAMWGCRPHWFALPREIRTGIWRAYQVGQEEGRAPVTKEYVKAARAAQDWIEKNRKPSGPEQLEFPTGE